MVWNILAGGLPRDAIQYEITGILDYPRLPRRGIAQSYSVAGIFRDSIEGILLYYVLEFREYRVPPYAYIPEGHNLQLQ